MRRARRSLLLMAISVLALGLVGTVDRPADRRVLKPLCWLAQARPRSFCPVTVRAI